MRPFFRVVSAPPLPRIVARGTGRAVAIEVEEIPEPETELSSSCQAEQLAAAKEHLAALQRFEQPPAPEENEPRALAQAWRLGQALAALKRQAGHGRWLAFLAAEFPQLSHQNASRYLCFFRSNPAPNFADGSQSPPESFRAESIRRLRWNYVPSKERPPAGTSLAHRGFVGAFKRWERRMESSQPGFKAAPVEILREDCGPVLLRLAELLGREYVGELLALPVKKEEAHP